jgi:hypothetical protein
LRYDVAFTCRTCNVAVLFEQGKAEVQRLHWAAAKIAEAAELYLPVWRVRGQLDLAQGTPQQQRCAMRLLGEPTIYVTGFQASRSGTFGDLGTSLTRQADKLSASSPPPLTSPFGGIVRRMDETIRLAELVALQLVDQRCDVTGMTLRLREPTLEIWAVPFKQEGAALKDLVLGTLVPTLAVDDLEELLSLQLLERGAQKKGNP